MDGNGSIFRSRDWRLMSVDIRLGKLVPGKWELGYKGMDGLGCNEISSLVDV